MRLSSPFSNSPASRQRVANKKPVSAKQTFGKVYLILTTGTTDNLHVVWCRNIFEPQCWPSDGQIQPTRYDLPSTQQHNSTPPISLATPPISSGVNMTAPRLKLFVPPELEHASSDAAQPTSPLTHLPAVPARCVRVSLQDVVPLLMDAARANRCWLEDFADETIDVSQDLYDILVAYRRIVQADALASQEAAEQSRKAA